MLSYGVTGPASGKRLRAAGRSIITVNKEPSSPWEAAEGTDRQPCLGDKGTAEGTVRV